MHALCLMNAWNESLSSAHKIIIYQNYSAHFSWQKNVNQINFRNKMRRIAAIICVENLSWNYYCTQSVLCSRVLIMIMNLWRIKIKKKKKTIASKASPKCWYHESRGGLSTVEIDGFWPFKWLTNHCQYYVRLRANIIFIFRYAIVNQIKMVWKQGISYWKQLCVSVACTRKTMPETTK